MLQPYQPRPIRFLELWPIDDWRIKVYGIAYARAEPRQALVAAAKLLVPAVLRSLPAELQHYRLGFLGVTSNFVFFDFWADENELHHHVFVSALDQPDEFQNVTATGLSACVWDLRLQAFERDAWVTHVLQQSELPDFEGYLAARMNAEV
jgi:hypothetical protein